MTFPLDIRNLFVGLPEEPSHIATQPPEWRHVFTPSDHEGALDPHRTIVVGDRGTGKSFWSSVLVDRTNREHVAARYPRLNLSRVVARLGFSDGQMAADHPSPSEIATLVKDGADAEDIWRAATLAFAPLRPDGMPDSGKGNWKPAVDWVRADPARRNAAFASLNEQLTAERQIYVLVFDALDVIAEDWTAIRSQIRGLLRLALGLRSLASIRLKLFMRPDMADDQRLWAVGDASKLRHNEVALRWPRTDLYGLLWTLLSNPSGADLARAAHLFRETCERISGHRFEHAQERWTPPRELAEDEQAQRQIFHSLAGPYMGNGPKTGDTYKWVPNHLADAAGYAAPRSFLLAMRAAAQYAGESSHVLDRTGLEEGARAASKTRVSELTEDYRWMPIAFDAMNNLIVPILEADLTTRWQERGVLLSLKREAQREGHDRRFIPPGAVLDAPDEDDAYAKLVELMINLRIFFRLSDDRINMPDLFRLHANVKRKGGVPPRR